MDLKVGLVSEWYDPETGAAAIPGVIARSLANRGVNVSVLTGLPSYPHGRIYSGYRVRPITYESIEGIPIARVPILPNHTDSIVRRAAMWLSYAAAASLAAPRFFADRDAILVHMTPATTGLPASALKALKGIPYVLHVEDLWPNTVLASRQMPDRGRWLVERGLHALCDHLYRGAHSIAGISPGMLEVIASRGIPETKLHFAPNWADERAFKPSLPNISLRETFGIERPFNVMYAGNLGEFQALPLLLEAASLLKYRLDIGFVLVGDGVMKENLRAQVENGGLTNVSFLAPRPAQEMGSIMAMGDVHFIGLVDDPLFEITLPSKLQGTMASGCAILGAVSGDAAQVIRASNGGVVVERDAQQLASAILRFADDPHVLRQAQDNSYGFYSREMSEARSSSILIQLLQEAAEGRQR